MTSEEKNRKAPPHLVEVAEESDTVANEVREPTPEEVAKKVERNEMLARRVIALPKFGSYLPEEDDPNVLVFGPWLERGGSALWVSTAGTGKSIASIQFALSVAAGESFCGFRPHGKLSVWIFQSEDSPRRVAQDRLDVIAELAEKMPDVNWEEAANRVKIITLSGKVGPAFVNELDALLTAAEDTGEAPDVIILNPLLAFIGGPITDGGYVTPFLRGGEVGRQVSDGLQTVIERHRVGLLVFHHTPKPPTDKEIDVWMKSAFPEYQGAGSSDLTNWFRSCVTMMRVKGHPDMVCVTAGKNGAELGWPRVAGAFRRYMAYSDAIGVSGKSRHAWRELTAEEYAEVAGADADKAEEDINLVAGSIADGIKASGALKVSDIEAAFAGRWSRLSIRLAKKMILDDQAKYHITVRSKLIGRQWTNFVGLADSIEQVARIADQGARIEASREAEEGGLG